MTALKGKTGAVIAAAGMGRRMGADRPKQFLTLAGKPILLHTAEVFESCSSVDEIVVVTGKDDIEQVGAMLKCIHKLKAIVSGGAERQDSVLNGIYALSEDIEYVLIHDGVRPFIEACFIQRLIDEVKKYPACIMGVKVKDTVKVCDEEGFVVSTPPRASLWNASTPQAFRKELIIRAYEKIGEIGIRVTDDAAAAEYIGTVPKMVEGSYRNIKITTPEDLLLGEALMKHK